MIGLLALITAAIFFGAAFYISIGEHPARMMLDDRAALSHWLPAYKRGFGMQASIAVISGVLGLLAWWHHGGLLWLLGAAAILANWPYTLIVLMPVNRRLESAEIASAETSALLKRWGHLHAVRSILGFAATIVYFFAAMAA